MSFYRQYNSRSPSRSPIRTIQEERQAAMVDQINLRRSIRTQAETRSLIDQISLLKIKLRKTEELQVNCETLIRQNTTLSRENDALARELNERKFEFERLNHEYYQTRAIDERKISQFQELNRNLDYEINLLKKERAESNNLYEEHIKKLEILLEQKLRQLDAVGMANNQIIKEKEMLEIQFEEEVHKLKNLISRNNHEFERENVVNRQRQQIEKGIEIETLKKNHLSQIQVLDDEIRKLKISNDARTKEFQSQIVQNKSLKNRYEEEISKMIAQNDNLRQRLLKLQQFNRDEVEKIQEKYNDIHHQGTTSIKETYEKQIRFLLDEIQKYKWIIQEKNNDISNLVKEKRQNKALLQDKQLQFSSSIETLKAKLKVQQEKANESNQQLTARISNLINKLLRESESYHERIKQFNSKIGNLQAQLKTKQSIIEKSKGDNHIKQAQFLRQIEQLEKKLFTVKKQYEEQEAQKNKQGEQFNQYKQISQKQIRELGQKIKELEVVNEQLQQKIAQALEDLAHRQDLSKTQLGSLRINIQHLQKKLAEEQQRHSKQMKDFAQSLKKRYEDLQSTQKSTINKLETSNQQGVERLNERIVLLQKSNKDIENQLKRYIDMYNHLEKYFASPHEGQLFEEKSENNIFEVLSKVNTSSINIF